MKKKYCKDCQHLVTYERSSLDCIVNMNLYSRIYDPINGEKLERVVSHHGDPRQKNKDFDCPDYKRKWWKFWV